MAVATWVGAAQHSGVLAAPAAHASEAPLSTPKACSPQPCACYPPHARWASRTCERSASCGPEVIVVNQLTLKMLPTTRSAATSQVRTYLAVFMASLATPPSKMAARLSTCEIKEHLGFLRAVHVASSRGKGSLLYADGPSLRAAVRAYYAWLVKAAELGPWSRAGDKTAAQARVTRAPHGASFEVDGYAVTYRAGVTWKFLMGFDPDGGLTLYHVRYVLPPSRAHPHGKEEPYLFRAYIPDFGTGARTAFSPAQPVNSGSLATHHGLHAVDCHV